MYQRTFLNAFNVRQRVTSPLFHTSSYYLKDWIEQVAWLGIYQYNNTYYACSYTQKYDAVVHINMVLHGNVIYPYISVHVNSITFTRS